MDDSVLLAWPKRTKRSRLHRLGYSALLRSGNGWNSLRSNSIHFCSALRVAPLHAHPLKAGPFLLTSDCSCSRAVPDCRIRTCFIPRLNFVTHLILILTLWHFDILTQFGCEANSCFLTIACFWAKDSSLLPRYKLALPDENLSILIFANSITSDRFLMGYLRQIDYVCLREFIQLIYKPIHS